MKRDSGGEGSALSLSHLAMLRDIEREMRFTHPLLGKEALDPRVMAAMAKVPRERFVPLLYRHHAFANAPVSIGHGQTISQPYMVALMTDLLEPRPESIVLDVGSGSGYQAAVLAELVRRVHGVEIIQALARSANQRLKDLGYDNVTIAHADGWRGCPEQAPFDGIIVAAAAPAIPPPLLAQLKPGGRLVMPIGHAGEPQALILVEKRPDGGFLSQTILTVAFVPLTRSVR